MISQTHQRPALRPAFCVSPTPLLTSTAPHRPSCLVTTTRGQFATRIALTRPPRPVVYRTHHHHNYPSTAPAAAPAPAQPAQRVTPSAALLASITSLASTGAGIFILGFIVFVHESGHYLAARLQQIRVKNFSVGFGPPLLSFTPRDSETEFTIRLLPLGGYVAFPEHVTVDEETGDEKRDPHPDLLQNRPVRDRAIVVSAGVIANVMLAWAAIFTSVTSVGLPTYDTHPGAVVAQLMDTTGPAAQAGLRAGDIVTAVDGAPVPASLDSAGVVANKIRTSRGRPLELAVSRGDADLRVRVRPACCTPEGAASMGVQLVPNAKVVRVRAPSVGTAIRLSNDEFARLWRQTWRGLTSIVTNFQSTSQNLSGPVGVVSMGADLARNDTGALFTFCAVISINLALINSLPLPALDGGQMAFLVVEALRGSPVSLRVQDAINRTALLLFLAFSGVLFFGDLERLNILGALTKMFG